MSGQDFIIQAGPLTTPYEGLLPILLAPLLGALINALFGARLQARFGPRPVHLVAVGAMVLSSLLALVAVGRLAMMPAGARYLLDRRFTLLSVAPLEVDFALALDPLAAVMILVITLCGTVIHLYATGYMKPDEGGWRFFACFNLFVAAMLLLVLADSLLLCFFGWEGVGLCSYLLIGFWYRDRANVRAADKAFLVNRVGDLGFLVAMLLLVAGGSGALGPHGYVGREAMAGADAARPLLTFRELRADVARKVPPPAAAEVAATEPAGGGPLGAARLFGLPVTLLVGLALFLAMSGKSAQLPLHVWLPDAMAGPTPVSALIHAATMVTAGVYLAARLSFLLVQSPAAMAVIAAAGVLTAFVAAAMAVVQHDIKRVLAYSTISQLGFMFLAVGVGAFGPALFHLVTHAGFKACLFLAAGSVIHALHGVMEHRSPGLSSSDPRRYPDPADPQDLRNMGGLARALPRTRLAYLLGAVAIAGFPVASGFYSKDEILWRAFTSSTLMPGALLYGLAVLSAGLTAFYVFRSYYLAFRGRVGPDPDAAPGGQRPRESPAVMVVPLYLLGGASLLLGPLLGWPEAWGGHPLLESYLAPLFTEVQTFARARDMPVWTPFLLQAVGLGMTVAGWLLARRMYRDLGRAQSLRARFRHRLDGLHRLLWNRLRIDEIYRWLFVLPAEDFARAADFADRRLVDGAVTLLARLAGAVSRLGAALDARVVDGIVNGVSHLTLAGGRRLARLQTGRINHYVLGIALGAGALVALTWVIR